MSVVVHEVVSQFEFIEGNDLFHPLRTFSWRIWMNVNSPWHLFRNVQEIRFDPHHFQHVSWNKAICPIVHRTRNITVVVNKLFNFSLALKYFLSP